MKIRFKSSKENSPTKDGGIEVLYAPARRQAFKLRWYLILVLVATPFIVFTLKLGYSLFIIEMPAQILFSQTDVRSRDPAQVTSILVKPGDAVDKGQLLLEMDNPEWRMRVEQLRALSAESPRTDDMPSRSLSGLFETQLNRAEERLALVRRLVGQGAATQGELTAAINERDQRQADLLTLQQQNRLQSQHNESSRAMIVQAAEEKWLQERLDGLKAHAGEPAKVSEILVQEGENVGPGTLLLRMHNASDATLYAFIDLKHSDYAQSGQPVCVKLPDGQVVKGRIAHDPERAQSVPADIRAAFSAQKRDLLVTVVPDVPLPQRWLINQLPLKMRVSCHWPWSWLW